MNNTISRTIKKTVDITFKPATRFSFVDNGKTYLGYLPILFNSDIPEEELQKLISNANFVEMGYGSNVCFILPKLGYDSSEENLKKNGC